MLNIAKIWSQSFINNSKICSICGTLYINNIIHLVSECAGTANLRWTFISDILQYGSQFVGDLCDMDSDHFTLKLLGAELGAKLENDEYKLFLKRSFRYINDCTSGYDLSV